MNKLNWTNDTESHEYMRGMRDLNLQRSLVNPNENWMSEKLGTNDWSRQSLHGYRIFDFWNHVKGVAIEVDGKEHKRDYDNYRDEYNFRRSGIIVLRVRNKNEDDASDVIDTLNRIGHHRDRKHSLDIMGTKKNKQRLVEMPYDKNKLMFLDYMKSIGHTPYWAR